MTPRSGAASTAGRAWRIAAGVVIAVTLAAWSRVPFGVFQYDDHDSVVTSPSAPTLDSLIDTWRAGFRPLLRSSYLAGRWMWGERAAGFLAVNLAIHLACALAVLALARHRGLAASGGAAAALVFALQPAQSEAVAYVSGRSSSLMTMFLLLGLLAHDGAATAHTDSERRRRILLSLTAFAAAVATKEVALVFPLLVALWEGARSERRFARIRPLLFAHLALAATLTTLALSSSRLRSLLDFSFGTASPLRALAANLAAAPELLSLWIRPGALSIEHLLPAPSVANVALGAALVTCLVAAGLAMTRRHPLAALALLWVPVALLPTNSVIWKLDPISERSLYLAWVGPALAIGAAFGAARRRVLERPRLRPAWVAAVVVAVLAAGLLVRQRVDVWSDSRALWRDATVKSPHSVRAWNNLGMACWEHDEPEAARTAFRQALQIDPGDVQVRQSLLALALSKDGESRDLKGEQP